MPNMFPLLRAVYLCAAITASAVAADSANLLTNGNLETESKQPGVPEAWPAGKDKSVTWEQEEGNHFLRLHAETPGKTVMAYRQIALPADVKALELSYRWRCRDLKPGQQAWFDARIMMDFKDAAGQKLGSAAAPYLRKSTEGWVEKKTQFLVPEGARTLDFMPSLFQVQSGTLDLDDFVLRPVEAAPLQAAADTAKAAAMAKAAKDAAGRQTKAAAMVAKTGSLLPNGDFEKEGKATGWPDGWPKQAQASWEKEGDNHFLRLKASEPGKTVMLYRLIDLPAGTKALEMTWRQRVTDLKPGKEPWFDARIMMEFKDAAGKKLAQKPSPPYTRNNTEGWVEKRTQFLVPEGAISLEFMPSLFQVVRGTLDLDDIVFKATDPATLIAAQQAAAEDAKKSIVPPEALKPAKWPSELHVTGNQVLNKEGKPVWLQGVNVVSLEFLVRGDHVLKSLVVAIEDWKSNIIRLPVKEEYWFGKSSEQKDGGAAYRELVDTAVTLAANRGAYVLLDLHRFGAPRPEHADFWKDAATRYKNHPALIFDLFNEPHGISWEVWRDGGFVAEKKKPADEDAFLTPEEKAKQAKGFQSIGMQALLDAVRGAGAQNVVLVGGLDWSYDLTGIAKGFGLKEHDGGHGIIYASHIYPWKRDWPGKVLLIADQHPILLGEVGADIHKMNFIPENAQEDPYTWVPDMLGLIQKYHLHWTGFSFHPKATPIMIEDWSFKPTPYWGAFAKRALAGEHFELKKMR
jgi:hypothetical protein